MIDRAPHFSPLDKRRTKGEYKYVLCGDSPPTGLVGIAKLAAESEVLEAKRAVQYFEIDCRSVLNRTRSALPFQWSINPYRGCEFGCRYCYARYTHEFMELRDSADFEDRIYAKSNVGNILRRELRRTRPTGGIAIGTATDPYQPAERRFKRTRAILEAFAEQAGLTIHITTKSDLVTHAISRCSPEIAHKNNFSVNMTITTLDTSLARELEPRAPRPDLRLKAVQSLSQAGITVGVFPNPIMPLITDRGTAPRPPGQSRPRSRCLILRRAECSSSSHARDEFFLPFVAQRFPHLLRPLPGALRNLRLSKGRHYRDMIRDRIATIRDRATD